MSNDPIDFRQGKENKNARDFMRGYHERGNKTREMSKEDAEKFGMSIESKPGAVMGKLKFKTPEHKKVFDDHMRNVYAQEREAEAAKERNVEASAKRQSFKVYGGGHDMSKLGEGKKHGED